MKSKAAAEKIVQKPYGWGIVDKDGAPYWSEYCVCEDREPMDDEVKNLNDSDGKNCPYRVVKLYFFAAALRRKK